ADEGVGQPLRFLLVPDREVEGLLTAPEFDERGDRVQPVRVLVRLCPQRFGQRRHRREFARELLDVRAIAQGRHRPAAAGIAPAALDPAPAALESSVTAAALIIAVAVAAVAAARLARPLLTDDEYAVLGEVDLVDGD